LDRQSGERTHPSPYVVRTREKYSSSRHPPRRKP
jgi:hypothetical protein